MKVLGKSAPLLPLPSANISLCNIRSFAFLDITTCYHHAAFSINTEENWAGNAPFLNWALFANQTIIFHLRKLQSNFLLSNLLYLGGEGPVAAAAATIVSKCLSAFAVHRDGDCLLHMYVMIRQKELQQVLMTFLLNQAVPSHGSLATSGVSAQDLWRLKDQRAKKSGSCGEAPALKLCAYRFSPRLKVIQAVIAGRFLSSDYSWHKFPLGYNWITCSGFCYLSVMKSCLKCISGSRMLKVLWGSVFRVRSGFVCTCWQRQGM